MSEINYCSYLPNSIHRRLEAKESSVRDLLKKAARDTIAAPQITIGHTYRSSLVFLLLIALPRDLRNYHIMASQGYYGQTQTQAPQYPQQRFVVLTFFTGWSSTDQILHRHIIMPRPQLCTVAKSLASPNYANIPPGRLI